MFSFLAIASNVGCSNSSTEAAALIRSTTYVPGKGAKSVISEDKRILTNLRKVHIHLATHTFVDATKTVTNGPVGPRVYGVEQAFRDEANQSACNACTRWLTRVSLLLHARCLKQLRMEAQNTAQTDWCVLTLSRHLENMMLHQRCYCKKKRFNDKLSSW